MRSALKPWLQLPPPPVLKNRTAIVVGGGVAGAAAAYWLAHENIRTILLEREPLLGSGASGNPAAVVMPVLGAKPDPATRFFRAGYEDCLAQIAEMTRQNFELGWRQTGIIHLLNRPRLSRIHERLAELDIPGPIARACSAREASAAAGLAIDRPALFYELGGHINPRALTESYARRLAVELRFYTDVRALEHDGQEWRVFDEKHTLLAQADIVILANGFEARNIAQTTPLPLSWARGQIASIPVRFANQAPKTVLCHDGFFIPDCDGFHLLGATWDQDVGKELSLEAQQKMIRDLTEWLPELRFHPEPPLRGRIGFRTQSPDHLPLIGPVPDWARFQQDYADLHHGRPAKNYSPGHYLPGLYVSVGHGGRGMITAGVAGQLLAAQITGKKSPLDADVVNALNPARFLIRKLKRKPEDRHLLSY